MKLQKQNKMLKLLLVLAYELDTITDEDYNTLVDYGARPNELLERCDKLREVLGDF